MDRTDFTKISTYIGKVVKFYAVNWSIDFEVPGIIEKQLIFPQAMPIFPHVFKLQPGDEVFIIKLSQIQNDNYVYLPLSIYEYIGLKYLKNQIDLTNDGIIDVETDQLSINLAKSLVLKCGQGSITINSGGKVEINGTLTVKGGINDGTAASGLAYIPPYGPRLIFKNGILKTMG